MPIGDINRDTVIIAWRTFSSIMIEMSASRYQCANSLRFHYLYYRIVFPDSNIDFPEISLLNRELPELLQGHSYPVCSCPAYYYNNNNRINGSCKHIDEALKSLNIESNTINWSNRPEYLPYLLKNIGLNEYEWVDVPHSLITEDIPQSQITEDIPHSQITEDILYSLGI